MIIRPAASVDRDALTTLARRTFVEAFGDSVSASDLEAHLDSRLSTACVAGMLERDLVLVAEQVGDLIGFVQVGDAEGFYPGARPGDRVVCRLYVSGESQSRGIGSRLLEAALGHDRVCDAERVFLDVWSENHRARRFYERHGFVVIGERPFEVASGAETTPELMMVRETHRMGQAVGLTGRR